VLDLTQVGAAWPLAASTAAVAVRGIREGRRRTAINEALHEVRRPLQALALAPADGGSSRRAPAADGSLQLAAVALERLDREVNGRPPVAARATVPAEPLLRAAVGRWRARAALGGARLELRWLAGGAAIEADRCAIAQALDNLIVNAIEHGGGRVAIEARPCRGRLRISVSDSGRVAGRGRTRRRGVDPLARLSGRRRRGHGLRVVRRTAAEHAGEFHLRFGARGAEAVLELPLVGRGRGEGA
jgi:signal transduction histidine kinase